MANPFIDAARTLLDSLDAPIARELTNAARDNSLVAAGVELTIEEAIGLALVAKHIAATDGLSAAESTGMRALLSHYRVPPEAQAELLAIDLSEATDEHVRELVPAGSAKAMYLVSGVAAIAARDGLSEEEVARIEAIGATIGLAKPMIDALCAHAEAEVVASIRNDRGMLDKLDRLRGALFRLADETDVAAAS